MTTSVANLDITQYVKVNSERKSITLQSVRDEVRVVLSDAKPIPSNTVFHTLNGSDDYLQFQNITTDVWVLAMTTTSKLVVSETAEVGTPKDFFLEIRKGNVPGHRLLGKVVEDNNTSTTFKDVWEGDFNMEFRTDGVEETIEIVSDSVEDSDGGQGARQVTVNYLDADYIERSVTVTLNGTTPVQVATDFYRPAVSVVTQWNSGGLLQNQGMITIRVVGGNDRSYIPAFGGVSTDGHITVPANYTMYFIQVLTFLAKNIDARMQTLTKGPLPTDGWRAAGDLPYYQNSSTFEVLARIPVPEKTDLVYRCQTGFDGGKVDRVGEFLLIHNDYL